jgi:hypothetical protein
MPRVASPAFATDYTALAVRESQMPNEMKGGTLTSEKFVQFVESGSVENTQIQAVKDAVNEDLNDEWLMHCVR